MAEPAAAAPAGVGQTPLANAKHETIACAIIADPASVGWRVYKKSYPRSSQHACEVAASRLLRQPEFAARIAWLKGQAADQSVMSLNEVLRELSKLGRSNIKHCIVAGEDTAEIVMSLRNMPEAVAAAIQEFTVEMYVEGAGEEARDVKRVKVKLHDKRGPLSELRRHHEPDRHEHAGKDGGAIEHEIAPQSVTEIARRVAFALRLGQREAAAAKPAKPKRKT